MLTKRRDENINLLTKRRKFFLKKKPTDKEKKLITDKGKKFFFKQKTTDK